MNLDIIVLSNSQYIMSYFYSLRSLASLRDFVFKFTPRRRVRKVGSRFIHRLNSRNTSLFYSLYLSNSQYIMSYFYSLRSLASLRDFVFKFTQRRRVRKVENRFIHRLNSRNTTLFYSLYLSNSQYIMSYFYSLRSLASLRDFVFKFTQRRR